MLNDFEKTFSAHLFVEMYYNKENRSGFIFEEKLNQNEFNLLSEAYGVFNGCESLVKEIIEHVNDALENSETCIEFETNKCEFIKRIKIIFKNTPNSSYSSNFSKIIDNKFSPLYLVIGKFSQENIISTIMHEVLHAYEDYKRYCDKVLSIGDISKYIGYNKNPIINAENLEEYERRISYLLYHLSDFERNAYIAQIRTSLSFGETKFLTINDAFKYIRTTLPYRNYQTIFKWGSDFCDISDKKTQSYILNVVNNFSNNNFKTYRNFTRWLKGKMVKYQKKFNSIIPKIVSEIFELCETLNPPINYLIE